MKKSLIAVAVAGVLATGAAVADNRVTRFDDASPRARHVQYDPSWDGNWRDDERQLGIDRRQARLHERIQRGFDDGRLTRREARRLEYELQDIEAKERAFEADGRLDRRETAELQEDLDVLAARLREELRDDQRRY